MQTATPPWAPQQGQWLQALGYTVYRLGDAPEAVDSAPVDSGHQTRPDAAVMPEHRPAPATPAAAMPAPRRVPAPRDVEVRAAAAAPAGGGMRRPALPDRLQLAMLRVSGLDPADPAARALMESWPVAELRGNAAAKRAFWPTLRALRKAAR